MNKESRTDESSPDSAGSGHRCLGAGLQEMVRAGVSKLWTHSGVGVVWVCVQPQHLHVGRPWPQACCVNKDENRSTSQGWCER